VPTPTPRREDEAEAIWRPRADALISYFENSTTELQYGYAEALGDGRGITAGRAGFTSGTGDLVLVVERVVAANPDNELAEYLPELRRLADAWSPDVSGLVGFERVWAAQAQDPTMRDAQDAVVDELYFFPSQAVADELGLELPLSRAAIFGTAIQHGIGDDPDGLPALAFEASTEVGGSPSSGVDELVWLRAFLATRKAHLLNAYDPATREVWAQSAGRVDTWVDLLDRGLVDLDQSFTATAFGSQFDID
jgi:chitosanase